MAKAISYRRFSSGAQTTGDSLKRQTEAAQAYCDANGDELDVSFVDAGMSAYRGKNATQGALARLVELAKHGTFEPGTKLIVEHLDRLSRADVPTAQQQFTEILRSGLTIVTLMDRQEYTYERLTKDIGALLISIVLMFGANRDSANKGERVAKAKASRLERVRAGEGVKMTRQGPGWLRAKGSGEKLEFVEIPDRVEVVRRIFELSLAGLGKRSIMSILNQEGVRPFRGGDGWHHSSVSTILRNSAVLGHFRPSRVVDGKVIHTGEVVRGYFPPILDEATFYKAQEATEQRNQPRAAGRKSIGLGNLFSGLGKCGQCGANLVYETRGNSRRKPGTPPRFKALVCDRAARHNGCANTYRHPYDVLEAKVLTALSYCDVTSLLGKPESPDASREAEIAAAVDSKTAEIERLVVAFGREPLDAVKQRIEILDSEIKAHKDDLEAHHRKMQIADADRNRDLHLEFLGLVKRMQDADMPANERYVLRSRIAAELRRRIGTMEADGEALTISLKESGSDGSRGLRLWFIKGEQTGIGLWPANKLTVQVMKELRATFEGMVPDFGSRLEITDNVVAVRFDQPSA
jgi:DNA invertase Pin-like site-specific DNA recombinase